MRADFAEGLELLRDEGVRADIVYLDLGISSMQVDTLRARLLLLLRRAAGHAHGPRRRSSTPRDVVNAWDERRLAARLREYGEERYAGQIARAIVRRRARAPLETTSELVDVDQGGGARRRRRFAGGHPAKRSFQAIRIAVNGELGAARPRRCRSRGRCSRPSGRFAGISFHSLEDRRVKRFLAERARGCICPPDLPVCACGRTPEAELLTRRAVAPTPGEVAAQPARRVRRACAPRASWRPRR